MIKVMITFREGGENGGPYISHRRIMESRLKNKYEFIPLYIPKGHLGICNLNVIKKLRDQIKANKPDIVHFTGLELVGWYGMLACKLANIKNTVMVIRGSTSEAIAFNKNPLKSWVINIIEYITLRNVACAYGVSKYVGTIPRVKKYCRNYKGHIYNLADFNENTIASTDIRSEFGFNESDIIIVSTGRIIKEKGYETLKNIIILGEWSDNVKFLIVGDGDYLSAMMTEIGESAMADRVVFAGYRQDIDNILCQSDIFIICTLHETLCNSVIEASYHGLPVVASDVGGIPEIIEHGKSGFLIDPQDESGFINAVNLLVTNKNKRNEMGKIGEEIIKTKFAQDVILDKIDKVYTSILEDSNNV